MLNDVLESQIGIFIFTTFSSLRLLAGYFSERLKASTLPRATQLLLMNSGTSYYFSATVGQLYWPHVRFARISLARLSFSIFSRVNNDEVVFILGDSLIKRTTLLATADNDWDSVNSLRELYSERNIYTDKEHIWISSHGVSSIHYLVDAFVDKYNKTAVAY